MAEPLCCIVFLTPTAFPYPLDICALAIGAHVYWFGSGISSSSRSSSIAFFDPTENVVLNIVVVVGIEFVNTTTAEGIIRWQGGWYDWQCRCCCRRRVAATITLVVIVVAAAAAVVIICTVAIGRLLSLLHPVEKFLRTSRNDGRLVVIVVVVVTTTIIIMISVSIRISLPPASLVGECTQSHRRSAQSTTTTSSTTRSGSNSSASSCTLASNSAAAAIAVALECRRRRIIRIITLTTSSSSLLLSSTNDGED